MGHCLLVNTSVMTIEKDMAHIRLKYSNLLFLVHLGNPSWSLDCATMPSLVPISVCLSFFFLISISNSTSHYIELLCHFPCII